MSRFSTKLCVAAIVCLIASIAFGAWTIDVPATGNPPTQVKQDESLTAMGKSEILNGPLRVRAFKNGVETDGTPYDYDFDQDIMTEMDGGWSYEITPVGLWWDNLGEHLLQIHDAAGETKAGRIFEVVEP